MSQPNARIRYTGLTPGADSNTYNLYDSSKEPYPSIPQLAGMKRFVVDLWLPQNGTLNLYKSEDRGATWNQVGTQAVTGSSTASTLYEPLIEEYRDFKVDFVNGGSAQTAWIVSMAFTDSRNPSS